MLSYKHIVTVLLLAVYSFVSAQETKRIEILNANSIEFDAKIGKDVKRLLGNVQFRHGSALMYCDSAYLNSKTNILEAFANVHIIQNDSIDLYGDFLNYDGNSKIAKVRQNVRLVHGNSTLTTDSLDYDRKTNIAHYFSWGYLTDQDNHLQSVQGYYYSEYKDYYAIDSVRLTNPDYRIYSDSLRYNTETDISYFYGPTEIISDSNYIYCEYGWYDTKQDLAKVSKNSFIQNNEKKLVGDSIFYDKNRSFGEAFSNVSIIDTSAKIIITGNYANYYENPDRAFVTDSALMTKYGGGDTLFLHADTLKMYTIYDSLWTQELQLKDSISGDSLAYSISNQFDLKKNKIVNQNNLEKSDSLNSKSDSLLFTFNEISKPIIDTVQQDYRDTIKPVDITPSKADLSLSDQISVDTLKILTIDTIKIVTAFHHAQIYKLDLQMRCDSLSYSSKDSIIRLYKNPVIWSDNQQVTADYIEVLTENNNPTEMYLQQNAFIALQDDSIRFNQIEGISMRGYFNNNNELYKLFVTSQAKSVFFPREEATEEQKNDSIKGDLVGANITESNSMMIWFKDNQPNKITLYSHPKGVMNPIEYKPIEEYILKGFNWKDRIRPKKLSDIFIWKEEHIIKNEEDLHLLNKTH